MQNRTLLKLFGMIAPLLTWLFSLVLPGRNARVARRECINKCRIMQLVQSLGGYVDPEGRTPLEQIVERCYALGSFPALWAVEGVGKDLAEFAMKKTEKVEGLLTGPQLDAKWDKAQLMLHAGAGIGFARHYIALLAPSPSNEAVREMVIKVVDLCRANSIPGYFGAAMESLGLASRFMRDPAFCRQVGEALDQYSPDSAGYFWRGAGRCLYFHPANFVPGISRPCRAIDFSKVEAPSPAVREGMLAGTTWALTVVNMDTPEVMEWAIAHCDDYDCASPGFFNGMVSSIVMRYDTTPNDPLITRFRDHEPPDPKVRELWRTRVRAAVDMAVQRVHPVLKKHGRLDEVFQYQDLNALVEQLESKPYV